MVRKAKEYITAGDIIQVVPSQRLSLETTADPFSIYRALRVVNPSPYMFFLDYGDYHIVGASPEMLVLVENGVIHNRPLAGTRWRGATPEEDDRLARELLADEKERAEHVMLVDLGRNDVGRVSKPGSVSVDELMVIENYSHVMHIVSKVTGELRDDLRPVDALRAALPGRHRLRRPEDPRHGDHRRAGEGPARHLRRRGRPLQLGRRARDGHRPPHGAGQGRRRPRPGRRRDRRRLRPRLRVRGDAEQGGGPPARRPCRRARRPPARQVRRALDESQPIARSGSPRRYRRHEPPAADRQLRLVHLQPVPVPLRAGRRRRRSCATTP